MDPLYSLCTQCSGASPRLRPKKFNKEEDFLSSGQGVDLYQHGTQERTKQGLFLSSCSPTYRFPIRSTISSSLVTTPGLTSGIPEASRVSEDLSLRRVLRRYGYMYLVIPLFEKNLRPVLVFAGFLRCFVSLLTSSAAVVTSGN